MTKFLIFDNFSGRNLSVEYKYLGGSRIKKKLKEFHNHQCNAIQCQKFFKNSDKNSANDSNKKFANNSDKNFANNSDKNS